MQKFFNEKTAKTNPKDAWIWIAVNGMGAINPHTSDNEAKKRHGKVLKKYRNDKKATGKNTK